MFVLSKLGAESIHMVYGWEPRFTFDRLRPNRCFVLRYSAYVLRPWLVAWLLLNILQPLAEFTVRLIDITILSICTCWVYQFRGHVLQSSFGLHWSARRCVISVRHTVNSSWCFIAIWASYVISYVIPPPICSSIHLLALILLLFPLL